MTLETEITGTKIYGWPLNRNSIIFPGPNLAPKLRRPSATHGEGPSVLRDHSQGPALRWRPQAGGVPYV